MTIKVSQSSSLKFCLSFFSLLVISLTRVATTRGQIPVETYSVPTTINRPTLKTGSQGEDVSQLQAVLKLLGYYLGDVDGVYSDSTASAVVKFQEDAGLMPNGIVDQNTWNRLLPAVSTSKSTTDTRTQDTNSDCDCSQKQASGITANVETAKTDSDAETSNNIDLPILKIGMRGGAVRGLQQGLKAKGFLKGKVDGIFGVQTQTAVKAAQRKYQQKQNGIVDTALWIALLR